MPEEIPEERLRELEYNCREEAYGDAKFGGTMLGCPELRALITRYRERGQKRKAAPVFTDDDMEREG